LGLQNDAYLAVKRYGMARTKHKRKSDPGFWVGPTGGLSTRGIHDIISRLCEKAGVPHVNPHKFRNTAAYLMLKNGMPEGAVMRIMGWTDRRMLDRYIAAVADELAREAHKRFSPLDRLGIKIS
jgi:integrase